MEVEKSPKFKSPFSRPPTNFSKPRESQFYEFSEENKSVNFNSSGKRPILRQSISGFNNDTMTINNTTMINVINI